MKFNEIGKALRKKNGSLSTRQIILIIILITGFLVVLFFLFRLNLGEETKSQICRNSVQQKDYLPSASDASLQCTTKYVCITRDGTCDQMPKPDEKVKVRSLEEIYHELSEQKANCWWMFGEGRVDYVRNDLTRSNYCSICHQTYFDDSLKSVSGIKNGQISKDKLYEYMASHNYSEGETYSEYILGTNNIQSLKSSFANKGNGIDPDDLSFGDIFVDRTYFDVMGITSDKNTAGWIASGAVFAGVTAISIATAASTGGLSIGAMILVEGVGGAAGYGASELFSDQFNPKIGAIVLEGKGINNEFMAPTFQEANSDQFKSLDCSEIVTKSTS